MVALLKMLALAAAVLSPIVQARSGWPIRIHMEPYETRDCSSGDLDGEWLDENECHTWDNIFMGFRYFVSLGLFNLEWTSR